MKIRGQDAFVCVACALASSAVLAQEPRDAEYVARLVRELGANSFQTRERAQHDLARLASANLAVLREAAASTDPEVRLRAQQLLRDAQIEQLWRGSTLTLRAERQRLSALLPRLKEQTANRVSTGARYEVFCDERITIDLERTGYWLVLDELCRQSGNHLRPHYDVREKGVVLTAGAPGQNPIAYAGPLRVELISVRRIYDDELSYKHHELKRAHSFKLLLSVLWEDQFRLTAYQLQPRVVAARTDTGQTVLASEASYEWNVVGPGVRHLAIELKLQPPELDAKSLASLLLEWSLLAVGDEREMEIEPLATGQSARQDGVEATIEAAGTKAESLYELVVVAAYDHLLPDPPESVFQENTYEIIDNQDQVWPLVDQAHDLRGELVRSKLVFRREGGGAENSPQRLRIAYPRLRSQRAIEILFRDVALPPPLE